MLDTMCCDLTSKQKGFKQPFKLFVTNLSLTQINWKAVLQVRACSSKTSVSELAVCPPDNTRARVNRVQPTMNLTGDQLTVYGRVWRSHDTDDRQRAVYQDSYLRVQLFLVRKPVQLLRDGYTEWQAQKIKRLLTNTQLHDMLNII